MSGNSETIGQRLREVRIGVAMTQAEFAAKMQVSTTTVTRYEGDNTIPDGNFLLKLEELFRADPAWILLGRTSSDENRSRMASSDESTLLSDYTSVSDQSKNAIRSIVSVIANLEKGKE
jgi:transcriptional regulator with XRE-family HTH domain